MPNKMTYVAPIALMLLASSSGYAQNNGSVTIGFTTVAKTLNDRGNPLQGTVRAVCKDSGAALGGASGGITTSTTKGTPGGGVCNSDYIVTGSASGLNIPEEPCASAEVSRPSGGWTRSIYYAFFDTVIVTNGMVVCTMGGN
jgi:hypothetical protein